MTRVVCVADLHENLIEIPPCDLLLIAGDISYAFKGDLQAKDEFLRTDFHRWLQEVPAKEIIVVAGNHDQSIEALGWPLIGSENVVYLQDKEWVTETGLKVWGTPWQPWFYNWAFNAPRRNGEEFLAEKYSDIPNDTDVIVSHGPPFKYGDQTRGGLHVGSKALRDVVLEKKPKLLVCGHIHEDYGQWDVDNSIIVNASIVNFEYKPVHQPWVLDL